MKKSLAIIMGLLLGALIYGELYSNEFAGEGFIVDEQTVMMGEDEGNPISSNEGCDCRESEEDDCDKQDCECECHELEIED